MRHTLPVSDSVRPARLEAAITPRFSEVGTGHAQLVATPAVVGRARAGQQHGAHPQRRGLFRWGEVGGPLVG